MRVLPLALVSFISDKNIKYFLNRFKHLKGENKKKTSRINNICDKEMSSIMTSEGDCFLDKFLQTNLFNTQILRR